jgi:HAD superfamily hydrolase (TIGR01509 family)
MTGARLVMLDIGSTLVSGPDRGPARRIADALGMADDATRELHRTLMTTAIETPGEVAAFVRDSLEDRDDDATSIVEEVWSAQEREAQPIDGAADTLERLRERGVPLAVVSNIWKPFLTSARRHFGAFFDEHVPRELQLFSFRLGCAKPSPAIFERALHAAGVSAWDAVMVGDSYHEDIEGAASCGIATVWVLHRPANERAPLVRVLDGAAQRPSRTIGAVAQLDHELISSAVAQGEAHADHRA